MFITFPDFRKNWISSYQWIEKELGNDLLGKVVASLAATTIAPVLTIISSIQNQLVNKQEVSEPTSQERYDSFVNWFNAVLSVDLNSDEDLKSILAGWNWFNNGLVLHFKYRPKENELSDIAERLQSYNMNFGWAFRNLGELYLHNFGTTSNWSVPVLFIDKIVENEASRVAELARVEREKELESLPISLLNRNSETLREQTKGKYPLWANRKGNHQLIDFKSHIVLVGSTGAGKTGTLAYWLWLINSLKNEVDELYILDYKRGKDWASFYGISSHYASAEDTKILWEKLYQQFKSYQTGVENIGDKVVYIIIDELASLVESYTTKKERDEFLRQFKDMLRLSRSLGTGKGGYRLIVGLQQADSSYFGGTEGRGNLSIRVALGGNIAEGARMIFEITDESDKPESSPVGKGFAQVYGQPVQRIMIPYVKDREQVMEAIARSMDNAEAIPDD
ncbi:ATP-binding protein [Streptococcus sp. sy004]|uniref:ATP-binding protein n=1 Tax=Streptococcus sp. sy004 TaxID=2600149 RepID=UPI0011B8BFC5|nr:ATP-binding protein [Streptococcus sp. sy004]TWT12313.1 hypothetical protein FRX54_01950 [Streptococcus sp. sy004]